jgi:hypothetical protein
MTHYELTRQERTQIDGRWHGASAPLCSTGDGHYFGVHPDRWVGTLPGVDCPRCCARKRLVAPRERNRVEWAA